MTGTTPVKSWMPLWLATWLFITGYVFCHGVIGMFMVMMVKFEVPYIWQCRYILPAISVTPWVWYFAYLRYRYLRNVPRLYYLWWGAPILMFIIDEGSSITLWSYYYSPYYLWIDVGTVITAFVCAFVLYETYHAAKAVGLLK